MTGVFPHLEMHQVFGRIAINTQKAYQEIHQSKADLSIQQPKAEMHVERRSAKVRIDQTAAWHNLDMKSAPVRNAEAAQAGKQAVLDGIARRSREGQELLHIERNKGVNLFAKQAADRMGAIGTHYETGQTPVTELVKYDVSPAILNITWQPHRPIIQATPHTPEITYHPGQVNVSMEQYPELDIQAVGLYVDEKG